MQISFIKSIQHADIVVIVEKPWLQLQTTDYATTVLFIYRSQLYYFIYNHISAFDTFTRIYRRFAKQIAFRNRKCEDLAIIFIMLRKSDLFKYFESSDMLKWVQRQNFKCPREDLVIVAVSKHFQAFCHQECMSLGPTKPNNLNHNVLIKIS